MYSLGFLLAALTGCGYGFVLKGAGNLGPVHIQASVNQTPLRSAAMIMDSHLESTLAAMGVSGRAEDLPRLTCTIVGARGQEISTNPAADNRFRLKLSVKAEITGLDGKSLWHSTFSDYGAYASGGQEENALDEACEKIAQRIAQSLLAIRIEKPGTMEKVETQESKVQ
ncbi:MAG: LPS assembly lipoprotein LptE [Syntrophaceae bacterium]